MITVNDVARIADFYDPMFLVLKWRPVRCP